ncbi:hypothetical protein FPV67DRAFT_1451854 [Lyophyllum atratum]|nr:hypothetical protein FPV67DRAFT_1451854 [Lyophyllum atratum]
MPFHLSLTPMEPLTTGGDHADIPAWTLASFGPRSLMIQISTADFDHSPAVADAFDCPASNGRLGPSARVSPGVILTLSYKPPKPILFPHETTTTPSRTPAPSSASPPSPTPSATSGANIPQEETYATLIPPTKFTATRKAHYSSFGPGGRFEWRSPTFIRSNYSAFNSELKRRREQGDVDGDEGARKRRHFEWLWLAER